MRFVGFYEVSVVDEPLVKADPAEGERVQSKEGIRLLRRMYEAYIGAPMPPVLRAPSGKPYFDGEGAPHFSLSHDGAVVFCVLDTDSPVGIDVCHVRTDAFAQGAYRHVFRRIYTDSERSFVMGADTEEEQALRFFRIWSQKEAVTKRTGEGLFGMPPFSKTELDTSDVTTFTCKMQTGVYIFSISGAEKRKK